MRIKFFLAGLCAIALVLANPANPAVLHALGHSAAMGHGHSHEGESHRHEHGHDEGDHHDLLDRAPQFSLPARVLEANAPELIVLTLYEGRPEILAAEPLLIAAKYIDSGPPDLSPSSFFSPELFARPPSPSVA